MNFSSFLPCYLWFFSACRLGRWEKWLACLVIHGCILIFCLIYLSQETSNSQFMFDQCICIYLTFVGFCFRENTDQYVFLCFAHTHFIFIWSYFFFTVTGMIHYCSMYLSIASKWGQKNESLFLRQKWMRQVFYFYIYCWTCNTTIYFFIYLNFFNTQAIVPYVNFIEIFLML